MKRTVLALIALTLTIAVSAWADFDRSVVRLWAGGAGDTTAVGMADSSNIIWTRGAQRMTLMLHPNRACRIAVCIKTYGDSLAQAANDSAASDTTKASVWPFNCGATAVPSSGDSTIYYVNHVQPTSVAPGSYEAVYEYAPYGAAKWGEAGAVTIDLHRICDNVWCTADRVQVRYRVLTAGGVVTMYGVLKTYKW